MTGLYPETTKTTDIINLKHTCTLFETTIDTCQDVPISRRVVVKRALNAPARPSRERVRRLTRSWGGGRGAIAARAS